MGYIRPAVPEDMPEIAALYSTVFRTTAPRDGLRSALHEIFFGHPWVDDGLPSLVYEGNDRRIIGCLGVMPRPMAMDGRPVQAAVSHTFMVDPASRATLAGMELIRAFLSGRQDVSLAQSTSLSRRIFEAIGGETSLAHSMGWTRVLRPSRYVLSFLKRRGLPVIVSTSLRPVCRTADWLTGRTMPTLFRPAADELCGADLDPDTLRTCLTEFSRDRALRPIYDGRTSTWLLELLAAHGRDVIFNTVLVRDSSRDIIGCYLYYQHATGVADVVRLAARPKAAGQVLDHLFSHAYRRGSVAVSGQLDPRLLPELGARHCLFDRGDGSWFLAHSRRRELLDAIHRGDALLTRLEVEWWIGFVLMRALALDAAAGEPRREQDQPAEKRLPDRPIEHLSETWRAVHRP